MKTNNLKQQAIEAAYGVHWKIVKNDVDENGWIQPIEDEPYFCPSIGELEQHNTEFKFRPKSLQGIETNNGWIDSEKDLPEQGGEYHVVIKGKLDKAVYVKSNRWLVNGNDYPKTTQTQGISHYQPIVKPKPPIF